MRHPLYYERFWPVISILRQAAPIGFRMSSSQLVQFQVPYGWIATMVRCCEPIWRLARSLEYSDSGGRHGEFQFFYDRTNVHYHLRCCAALARAVVTECAEYVPILQTAFGAHGYDAAAI